MNNTNAELLIGDNESLIFEKINNLLKTYFCHNQKKASKFCSCSSCKNLTSKQHPNVVFITPKKSYLLDDIKIIFEKVAFQLDENENFIFILNNVHLLNNACANRLLKVIEEPPAGYKFILITNNLEQVLPTISSRCVQIRVEGSDKNSISPLLNFFLEGASFEPQKFESYLKEASLSEFQSEEFVQTLYAHFATKLKKSSDESKTEQIEKILCFLRKILKHPPRQGSSNIFLKNLYISFPRSSR